MVMTLRRLGARSFGVVGVALAGLGAFGSGVVAQAPTVSALVLNSPEHPSVRPTGGSKPAAATDRYFITEIIRVRVVFSASVDVTGAPRVKLGLGTCTCYADYVSGTGTDTLTFEHEVVVGDEDADGMSIAADALELNGGTITATSGGAAASLGLGSLAFTNDTNRKVRDRSRTQNNHGLTSLTLNSPSAGDTYINGDTIQVTWTSNADYRRQNAATTPSQLGVTLMIGANQRSATYASGWDTPNMVFHYVVVPADMDADGISIVGQALTGGDFNHFSSRSVGYHGIVNSANHKVDGSMGPPGVSGVAITSTPVVGDTYEPGDTIKATVTFTQAVDVTGTPQLALDVGSDTLQASYASGTGGTDLVFQYVVASGNADTNGLSVRADALTLNSGTIRTAGGTTQNAMLPLGTHAITNSADHKVVGTQTAAAVSGVAVASTPVVDDTYAATDAIEVDVTFNRPVNVVTSSGTPQLGLGIGTNTRQAPYASGSGTRTLRFRYVVVPADADTTDGITVAAGALALNSGEIDDARSGSLAASLGLGTHALTAQAGHLVDGTIAPASLGTGGVVIASTPEGPNSFYGLGERIEARVNFDRPVAVTGSPQLAIDMTGVIRQATYAGGSGTTTLSFEYWVQGAGSGGAGVGGHDLTTAGIQVSSGALTLNGGTIKNVADPVRDFDASLSLTGYTFSPDSDHKVDGSIEATPVVTGAAVTSTPRGGQGYGGGEEIVLRVSFSRSVTVTGVPRLTLLIGSSRRQARYVTGSGTPALEFRYRVGPADTDPNGFSVPVDGLDLAGGAIVLAGGSAEADLGLGVHAMDDVEGQTVSGGGATDPYFDLMEYPFELKENVAGPVVVGEVLATDPFDGDLRYGLGEGGEGLFEVDQWGGAVTYVGEGEDAEERSEYVLEVVATAGERSGKALVRVRVKNVNEAPAYADERLSFELVEDVVGPVVLGFALATDRDEGDALTYAMESGDAERFEVDASTAEVRYVGPGEDYDTAGPKSWELKVRATDKAGLSAAVTVAVALRDTNEGPSFADSAYAFEFAENMAGPLLLGTVRATDPDASDRLMYSMASGDAELFAVDASSGQVRYVGSGEDAETSTGSWAFEVLATDGGGLSASASVTVTLLDRNEAPSFEDESYEWEFEENVAGPLVLGVVRATDPDAADTLAYRLEGAEAERFEVDAGSGEVRYAGPGEDAEAGPDGWAFEVVVADGDGLEDRVPATVVLLDVNEAPSFADSAYAFEFPENAGGPLELGRVEASDVDDGDVLTYGLASGDAGRFQVDATSGQVRYVGSGEDYEAGPREYALTLRVTDSGGLTAEAGATVALLDVNEGPEAVGSMAPKVLEAHGSAVEEDLGPYFRDPDGDALSYAAESSSDAVAVASVSSGRLSISPRAIGVATVTVTATDPGGLSATQQVQVTVEASRTERARALKLALAAFGRSLGTETVEAIGGRLGVESSSALGRSHVTLGNRSLGCGAVGGAGVGNESSCGWKQLARDATSLLGLQLTGPAATLLAEGRGAFGAPGGSLLFGDGRGGAGAPDMASGFGGDPFMDQQEPADQLADQPADGPDQLGSLTFNPVSAREMQSQSSFQLSFGGDAGSASASAGGSPSPQQASRSGWTLWGQANAGEFESSPEDGLSLEGRTRSAYVGLDYRFGSGLLLGLAGSRNTMASDFDSRINGAGTVDATLTSLYPYLHWSPRDGLGLWGLVGAGLGDADLAEVAGGAQFSADLDMRMAALGARQELVGALALKADAFSVRIESADGADLAGVTAVASRVRLAPELTGRWTVGDGAAVLRARLEVGGRYDGGDAETGMGVEAGAGFGFSHLGSGLSVDARGRTLLAHQEEQFSEWGASFAVRLQPGGNRGGLAFSLEPSWGDAASGAQALWQAQGGALGGRGQAGLGHGMQPLADAPGWTPDRMAMELGWGVVLPGGSEVVPFGRWVREGADGYRVNAGTRWTTLGLDEPGVQLSLDLFGEQVADGVQPAERRIGLLGQIGFR